MKAFVSNINKKRQFYVKSIYVFREIGALCPRGPCLRWRGRWGPWGPCCRRRPIGLRRLPLLPSCSSYLCSRKYPVLPVFLGIVGNTAITQYFIFFQFHKLGIFLHNSPLYNVINSLRNLYENLISSYIFFYFNAFFMKYVSLHARLVHTSYNGQFSTCYSSKAFRPLEYLMCWNISNAFKVWWYNVICNNITIANQNM